MSEAYLLKTVRPKKSLGQNFLTDNNILNKIITNCSINKNDTVLEIGAGSGLLTSRLVEKAKFVFAVEIDKKLYELLRANFSDTNNISVLNEDILKFPFSRLKLSPGQKIKVIANIPYYISTPIIEYLLKNRKFINDIFITIQKELADRITARVGSKDYSSLTCFLRFYTEPKKLFLIKRNSFWPRPAIDSCLLSLKILDKPRVKVKNEEFLFKIIRTAFQMRRKTLLNSLSRLLSKEVLKNCLFIFRINQALRPEDLTLEDFAHIADFFYLANKKIDT